MARLRKDSDAVFKRSAGILSTPEAFLFAILLTKRLNSRNVLGALVSAPGRLFCMRRCPLLEET